MHEQGLRSGVKRMVPDFVVHNHIGFPLQACRLEVEAIKVLRHTLGFVRLFVQVRHAACQGSLQAFDVDFHCRFSLFLIGSARFCSRVRFFDYCSPVQPQVW